MLHCLYCCFPTTTYNTAEFSYTFLIVFSYLFLCSLFSSLLLSQCKQTQLSLESHCFLLIRIVHTGWASSQSAASWAVSIAITTSRQESVVARVPLWLSGLVTLPGQPSMCCKSVWWAPNWLFTHWMRSVQQHNLSVSVSREKELSPMWSRSEQSVLTFSKPGLLYFGILQYHNLPQKLICHLGIWLIQKTLTALLKQKESVIGIQMKQRNQNMQEMFTWDPKSQGHDVFGLVLVHIIFL